MLEIRPSVKEACTCPEDHRERVAEHPDDCTVVTGFTNSRVNTALS